MIVQENVALGERTTFGVGGAARYFVEAASQADVVEAVKWAQAKGLPLFVLGGGSNLLVPDEGFDGLVLKVALMGVKRDGSYFDVGAGENWDQFVDKAVAANCAGVECLAGIPGSVGGTPVQNVGAYGQEVSETIENVRVLDVQTGKLREFANSECGFRYRESIFNTTERGRYIVLRVGFALRRNGDATLKYAELRERVIGEARQAGSAAAGEAAPVPEPGSGGAGGSPVVVEGGVEDGGGGVGRRPSLAKVARVVRQIRAGKGMLLVEGDPDCRSAGSFFKNPVVPVSVWERIGETAGAEAPGWPAGEGRMKVPAAWLLEQAGFVKGFGEGPVRISSKHTLALTNRGGARFADVAAMETEIVEGVERKFGVRLEREPVVMGG